MPPELLETKDNNKPYDIVIILGKLVTSNVEQVPIKYIRKKCEEAEKAGLSYKIIGDGHSEISKEMLQGLDGKISPSSSIHILGHGGVYKEKHCISLRQFNSEVQQVVELSCLG